MYEAYLNELYVDAVTIHGTPTKSISEILLDKAVLYGRNVEEAKEDVKNVLKVHDAVIILLKGVSEAHDKKSLTDGNVKPIGGACGGSQPARKTKPIKKALNNSQTTKKVVL